MKKLFFTIFLIFLNSCGYNPIYLNQEVNFSIDEIITKDKSKISYKIKNSLGKYINLSNKSSSLEVQISTKKSIRTTSKDEKGNAKTFEIIIQVELIVSKESKDYKKEFIESFSYQNKANKFDLKNCENDIIDNLSNEIILDINEYIIQLTQ